MRASKSMALAALALVSPMLVACGTGDDAGEEGSGTAGDGSIVVRGCNPELPLIPSNTAETCGGNPQDVVTASLIRYSSDDATPELDIAESIETDDNMTFTVKLKEGYMFSDGTEVLAHNFVDAWNYAAHGPNGYQGSYFIGAADIAGYDALQCTGEDEEQPCAGDGAPAARELTGLEVVDDHTFTITTNDPVSNLPVRLGYIAFAPLPDVFFEDPKAYGQKPVTAGPYTVDHWTRNEEIELVKNENYSGEFEGNVDTITFKMYTDTAAAYNDLRAGNLDLTDEIPTEALTDEVYVDDLEGRAAQEAVGVFQAVSINPVADESLDNPDLRKAISLAIDRQGIIDTIFAGTRTPADGWVSPVVDGYIEGQCGEWCEFDPDRAKQMLEDAGGYNGELTLTYNGDGDHGPWSEAACNSIRQTLEIECTARPIPTFAEFLTKAGNGEIQSLFRYGWQMDYPSIENFLVPLYDKDAASNYFNFNDPEFEELTEQAAQAGTPEEANELYQEAERRLAEDMRVIPLWFSTATIGWSDKLEDVEITPFGTPAYSEITLK